MQLLSVVNKWLHWKLAGEKKKVCDKIFLYQKVTYRQAVSSLKKKRQILVTDVVIVLRKSYYDKGENLYRGKKTGIG